LAYINLSAREVPSTPDPTPQEPKAEKAPAVRSEKRKLDVDKDGNVSDLKTKKSKKSAPVHGVAIKHDKPGRVTHIHDIAIPTEEAKAPTLPEPFAVHLTPAQYIAYKILQILVKHNRALEFFTIALRNFENPDPTYVHIRVNRDNVFKSELIGEKALGRNMEVYGDMEECLYDGMVEKKCAKYVRPQYVSRKDPWAGRW
jgi:hypothetical protein